MGRIKKFDNNRYFLYGMNNKKSLKIFKKRRDMKQKTVLITGSSRGIGRAIVEELKKGKDYKIIAPSRSELDLNSLASVKRFIAQYKDSPIEIIINNAGVNNPDFIDALDDKNIEETFNVNLISPIYLIRGLIGYMKEKRIGRIVNISSIFSVVSKEKRAIYSATKAGLNGLTRALAAELGPYNILVNSVCPGYTNTELTKKNVSETEKAKIYQNIPLGRFAEPKEIAKLVAFLVSEENTYITGQTIIIDGGFVIK